MKAGKSNDEVVQLTRCTVHSVEVTRSKLKKAGKLPADVGKDDKCAGADQTEADKKYELYQPETKTVKCSEVIKTCEYAGRTDGRLTCDYAINVGCSRGCDPEACTRYRKKGGK